MSSCARAACCSGDHVAARTPGVPARQSSCTKSSCAASGWAHATAVHTRHDTATPHSTARDAQCGGVATQLPQQSFCQCAHRQVHVALCIWVHIWMYAIGVHTTQLTAPEPLASPPVREASRATAAAAVAITHPSILTLSHKRARLPAPTHAAACAGRRPVMPTGTPPPARQPKFKHRSAWTAPLFPQRPAPGCLRCAGRPPPAAASRV